MLLNNESRQYVAGNGNSSAKIVIVGESPSYDELSSNRAFAGPHGRELDKILKDANINRSDIWLTYACKHYVTPNPPKKGKKIPFAIRAKNEGIDLQVQYNDLQTEISNINPNIIIALGSTALYACTGKNSISDYRGSIISGIAGIKVIGAFDPKDLLHSQKDYWQRYIIQFDFIRALKQSEFKEIIRPNRILKVARSSADLYNFISRKKPDGKPFKLSIDIEAKECIPVCIGIAFDKGEGLTIPLWNLAGHTTIPDSDMGMLWLLLAELLYDEFCRPIGQNFKYDEDKIKRLGLVIRNLHSDTLLKAFAINPEMPKNLAFITSIYTEEPFYKNEGMYEGSMEDLFIGCARDACVTFEAEENMDSDLDELGQREFYENFLMKLHPSYLKTENYGFFINEQVRLELIKKYIKWTEALNFELFTLCGAIINVNSPKQVCSLLYDNFKIPRREGAGEEILTQLLANVVKKPEQRRVLEIILEKRRVDKTISTYLLALPDYDGRMKTTYFLCLETGRTSTGQQDPPIRPEIEFQYNKKKIHKVMGTAFQTMTKHGDIGADIRKQYIPDKGEVFLNIDSSQAEARVVFLLANDEKALYAIDHHDYHALTASWFFGGTEDDWSKKKWGYEHPIRFCGKTLRHACHLGASKNRAALTVNTDARKYKILDANNNLFTITEKFAGDAIKIFHAKQPSIQQNFHKGIQDSLAYNKRRLIAGLPYGIEATFGGCRTFYDKWGDELFRQAYSYIPQRSVSDNTKAAKIRIESRLPGIKIILESHDALLLSIRISEVNEVAPIAREEMERPISFRNCSLQRRDLIIPAEIEIGENYMEFKKFRS